jgi:hypothetical protein
MHGRKRRNAVLAGCCNRAARTGPPCGLGAVTASAGVCLCAHDALGAGSRVRFGLPPPAGRLGIDFEARHGKPTAINSRAECSLFGSTNFPGCCKKIPASLGREFELLTR